MKKLKIAGVIRSNVSFITMMSFKTQKKAWKCVINCSVLACMSGKDDKQKGIKSKFFNCTVLNKIIGPGIHLEIELSHKDLFELIRSIWSNHLQGNQCWDQFKNKFQGEYIIHTKYNASYTLKDCFKKSTPPSTIHLIHKDLEKRTEIEFLYPRYLLVYTHDEYP